jgi:hypothetical protein
MIGVVSSFNLAKTDYKGKEVMIGVENFVGELKG